MVPDSSPLSLCRDRDARRNTLEPPKELEFIVEDVDAEYERLREHVGEVVTEPTTMPWGNRALLFRDPDGNLVNLFTPVTDDARAKFGV